MDETELIEYIDLLKENRDREPETFKKIYGKLVEDEVRLKYEQRDVEAIINNYLDEPDDELYVTEFKKLQEYRKECKAKIKALLGIN